MRNLKSKREEEKEEKEEEEHVSSNADSDYEEKKTKKQKTKKGFSYKTYQMFKSKNFDGSDGVIAALGWLEEMEAINVISKCSEEEAIQYSSQSFKGEALQWWNTLIQAKGRLNMYKLSWEEFKDLVTRKFYPMNEKDEIQIKFLNHRVARTNLKDYNTKFLEYYRIVPHLVTPENNKVTRYIWGLPKEIRDMVRSSLPQTIDSAMELAGYMMNGLIRTREEEKKENTFKREVVFKKNERDNKKPYRGEKKNSQSPIPLCKICNRRHFGRCRFNQSVTCTNCKQVSHATTDCWKNKIACYGCGETGHFQNECPKRKTGGESASGSGTKNEDRKGNARVVVLNTEKAAEMPEVITGHVIPVQLLPMTLAGFDIVLGMDWLSDNQARILCDKKAIEICANGKTIQIVVDKDGGHVSLISMIKASKCLRKGCLAFMVYVTEEPKEKKLEDVSIVSEFLDVFPEELPGIPPERDVEFRIDLVPGTAPIAKSPYRLV
ncbi:uncharacterized protein LOC143611584 [Bidens hawaiensis]|uniref:uncharacterized protein LOC143611584 n=1 Tax=Bidens hawaiensis TaxID=980011 RepID=UPI00404A1666